MDLLATAVVAAVALLLAAAVLAWWLRRRAAFQSALTRRGWQVTRNGDSTTVVPVTEDWTVTMSRSFAAQMTPPSSHVVTSTWTSPTPCMPNAALVAGPAPDRQSAELAAELLGALTPSMAGWLGIDSITGGRPLH
ncbi:MAG: hypothetical protein WBB00_02955, partial [Mycobacterium sp.]